jgi:hypothetical protein
MNVLRELIYIHSYFLPLNHIIDRMLTNAGVNSNFPHLCSAGKMQQVKDYLLNSLYK